MTDPYAAFLPEFLDSAEELVARLAAELEPLRADPAVASDLRPLLRGLHSLKGNSSFVPGCPMTPLAHAAEDAVEAARDGFVPRARLLDPLTAACDCFVMRIEEYRQRGTASPPTEREREIAAELRAIAAGDAERRGAGSRYFFAWEDVTEDLDLLARAGEWGAESSQRLLELRDRLVRLAAASGASGGAELEAARKPDPTALLRWLADRAVRVPVGTGAGPAVGERVEAGATARGGLVPRHFTVEAEVVDEFLEHAVELRVFGERLAHIDRLVRDLAEAAATRDGGALVRADLEQLTAELRVANSAFAPLAARLQERLLAIRRLPVKRLLDRHAAMIRDLAARLGKEATVVLLGAATRVDKSIFEQLEAPLTHLVRNAVDHGLEPATTRLASGKAPLGTITLRASSEGQWFELEVADDGAGIDTAALRRSAVERGFLDAGAAARLSDEQVVQLVFLPGLSSRREVDELSGRGVGMDEVFAIVRQLRGTVRIRSKQGQGTAILVRVPDTGFAIVRCVPVRVGPLRFFVPHEATRRWSDAGIDPEQDGPLIGLADVAPHLGAQREDLAAAAGANAAGAGRGEGSGRRGLVVVLESGGLRFGLHVDDVGREMDVVARPLDRELVRTPLWAMAALGEEREAGLILDVDGLAALLPAARARMHAPQVQDAV